MPQQPLNWYKSSYSGAPNNECVECAVTGHTVLIRDSKRIGDALCVFSADAWSQFVAAVNSSRLQQP
ncbi:DUF397 domain-containing protein [Streptomyces sp. NPDC056244]|uniref:DUF397 domain-containing protein n=1 Tax=Streptomyces sp. NPDC056244 TaxID=3345762 RepID=UPI0035DFF5A9